MKLTKTDNHLISYRLKIISSIGDFENRLLTWYKKSQSDLTWSNFKTHFSQAHEDLIKVRGNFILNSIYHQGNSTVMQLTDEFSQMKNVF